MKYTILICLLFTACGKPSIVETLQPDAHIVPITAHELTPVTMCGVHLVEIGGHVEDSAGQLVANGNYYTSGYYNSIGFYIPPCEYMVVDGKACLGGCPSIQW